MNRANFGNITTNGMQILSVGATTASRLLGHAETALNNLSPEEQKQFQQYQTDRMRKEMNDFYNPKPVEEKPVGRKAYDTLSEDDQKELFSIQDERALEEARAWKEGQKTEKERQLVAQAKHDKQVRNAEIYNAKGESPTQHVSPETLGKYQASQAVETYGKFGPVDEMQEEKKLEEVFDTLTPIDVSDQALPTAIKVTNDINHKNRLVNAKRANRTRMNIKNTKEEK